MPLQLADGLGLLPDELVHPPPLPLVLSAFSHSPFLLTLNLSHVPLFLVLYISPKISQSLINGLHTLRHPMNVLVHLSVPLTEPGDLHLKVHKRLKEASIKRYMGRGGGTPYLKVWVLWLRWRLWSGFLFSLRLPMLLGLLPYFFTLLITILTTLLTLLSTFITHEALPPPSLSHEHNSSFVCLRWWCR